MYQELALGNKVMLAQSLTWVTQPACAVSEGSIVAMPWLRRCVRQSAIQSTCCSIDTIILDSTEGLPGPVIVKKFGKPVVIRPRYVAGPCAHFCFSVALSRPVMSTATKAPVIASKPVAKTMASNSIDSFCSAIPPSVILSIGLLRRSTKRTCGKLKVA